MECTHSNRVIVKNSNDAALKILVSNNICFGFLKHTIGDKNLYKYIRKENWDIYT